MNGSLVKKVIFEIGSAWSGATAIPSDAAADILRKVANHSLYSGFWNALIGTHWAGDDRIFVTLDPTSESRTITRRIRIEVVVVGDSEGEAIQRAYAKLADPRSGPWPMQMVIHQVADGEVVRLALAPACDRETTSA